MKNRNCLHHSIKQFLNMRSNLKMVLKSHHILLKYQTEFPVKQNASDFPITQRQTSNESFWVLNEKLFFRFVLQFRASRQLQNLYPRLNRLAFHPRMK